MIAITILSITNLVLLGALTLLAKDFINIKKQLLKRDEKEDLQK